MLKLTVDSNGRPHMTYSASGPDGEYYCELFYFGGPDGKDVPEWCVLKWLKVEDDDHECVEAYDDFGPDLEAALKKFAEVCQKK